MKIKYLLTAFIALIPVLLSAELTQADCSEDVLFRFFPQSFVLQVLEKHNVPKEQAADIAANLADSDQLVVQLIEQKAKQMNPNPLEDENAGQARAKLFHDAITETFNNIVNKYGITDTREISMMLDEIQKLRMERFEKCRKEGLVPNLPQH